MRGELALVRRQAQALAYPLDLGLQLDQVRRRGRRREQGVRFLAAENAEPGQAELELEAPDAAERIGDLVGDMMLDIADEAQRQVIVLDVDPAGARQAAAQEREGHRRIVRNLQGGKQTRHEAILSGVESVTGKSPCPHRNRITDKAMAQAIYSPAFFNVSETAPQASRLAI